MQVTLKTKYTLKRKNFQERGCYIKSRGLIQSVQLLPT